MLDSLHHVRSEQRSEDSSHLLDVLQDQVGVEPLEHHVGLVARVGQEGPGGDLGPLRTDGADTVSAVSADTGLQNNKTSSPSIPPPLPPSPTFL